MSEKYADTLQGILDAEYYNAFSGTAAEALVAMLDDFNAGRMTDFLADCGVGEAEFIGTVNRLAVKWASEGVLNKPCQ